MNRRTFLALAVLAMQVVGGPARGEGIIADLSSHLVAISSGFTGASVVLFGATEGGGDIIAVVRGPERAARFREALIAEQQSAGLFGADIGKVNFLGERLFRATITFPTNVPTGNYLVEVFLVRDRDVVSGQTTPLVVSKVGLDAAVSDFASREAAAYGAIAVLTAVMAGWLASLPFRGV